VLRSARAERPWLRREATRTTTDDRALAAAVANWFDAQLRDHGGHATTGDDAPKH
jgi:hypothetical protein